MSRSPGYVSAARTARIVDARTRYESHLLSLYGHKPLNIFANLRQELEISHDELAKKMYTTKQSLIRLEQGLFEEPPEEIIDWWLNNYGSTLRITRLGLLDQYEDYQTKTRQRHRQFFGPSLSVQLGNNSDHPFKQLRERCYHGSGASVNEVAKALCIHQSTLQYWEKRWKNQQSVPKAFTAALLAIGYSRDDVAILCNEYSVWRQYKLGRAVTTND